MFMIIQQRARRIYSAGTTMGRQQGLVTGDIGLAKVELLPRALPGTGR